MREAIQSDYLGPVPKFTTDEFKRIFPISMLHYCWICNIMCHDALFRDGYDPICHRKISVDTLNLMALKCYGYGVSANSFCNYFQMGESTGIECTMNVAHVILGGKLREKIFRPMGPAHLQGPGTSSVLHPLPWENSTVAYSIQGEKEPQQK